MDAPKRWTTFRWVELGVRIAAFVGALFALTRFALSHVRMDHSIPYVSYDRQLERLGSLQYGSKRGGSAVARFSGGYIVAVRVLSGRDRTGDRFQNGREGATFQTKITINGRELEIEEDKIHEGTHASGVTPDEDEIILWGGELDEGDRVQVEVSATRGTSSYSALNGSVVFEKFNQYTVFIVETVFAAFLLLLFVPLVVFPLGAIKRGLDRL